MSRQGRELELVLEKLHQTIDRDAYKIESPCFVKDLDTGKEREIDVGIWKKGEEGENLLFTVECRDRGAVQDVTWVEQLITKKESVGAIVSYVVTSSSFTKPAQVKASKRGVILRRIENFDSTELEGLLKENFLEIHSIEPTYIVSEVIVEPGKLWSIDPNVRCYNVEKDIYWSFEEFISDFGRGPVYDIDKKIHKDGEELVETFRFNPKEQFLVIESDNPVLIPKLVKILRFNLEVKAKKIVEIVSLSTLKKYKENFDDELIGELFDYQGKSSLSIDKQSEIGKWFFDLTDMPINREITRIGFRAPYSFKLTGGAFRFPNPTNK